MSRLLSCIVCGAQTPDNSPICSTCQGAERAAAQGVDDNRLRLAAALRSERSETGGDTSEIDLPRPADGHHLPAVRQDDDTIVLRIVEADDEDDEPVALPPMDEELSRRLINTFLGEAARAQQAALPSTAGPEADEGGRGGTDADVLDTAAGIDEGGRGGTDADVLDSAAGTNGAHARTHLGNGRPTDDAATAAVASARRAQPPRPPPPAPTVVDTPDAATDRGEPATADREEEEDGDQQDRWQRAFADFGGWIAIAQSALMLVALLCLAQLIVLVFIEVGLSSASDGSGDGLRALAAHHKAGGIMIPMLVACAMAATAFAAWQSLTTDDAPPVAGARPRRLVGIPVALWGVLFTSGVLLGASLATDATTVAVARRVNQFSIAACALLMLACVLAARALAWHRDLRPEPATGVRSHRVPA